MDGRGAGLRLGRRGFMAAGAAAGLAPMLPATASDGMAELVAAESAHRIAPGGYPETRLWTFGGAFPGPEIRLPQSTRLERRLVNRLGAPTSVHWHGLRLPNGMDGVPGVTQAAVGPGESFDYAFDLPDAGTFWYHSHHRSFEQVDRGLAGALVVEEAEPPEADAEHVLMLDDIRLGSDAQVTDDFGSMHDRAHAGRIGNVVLASGRMDWRAPARGGERLRLRIVNAAGARIFDLGAMGLEGWVMALDGMPLAEPRPLDRLVLAPAQRADLLVDVTGESEALLVSHERDGGYAIATFEVTGGGARRPAPGPLPPNPVPSPDGIMEAPVHAMRLEGGAMGGMTGARVGGGRMGLREMVSEGLAWAMAGSAGMPDEPFISASAGEPCRVAFVNDTAWPHAMHLHGMHFWRIGEDGPGDMRDTVLVMPDETAHIGFIAERPGAWLLHCHMLGHAASGMTSRIEVA